MSFTRHLQQTHTRVSQWIDAVRQQWLLSPPTTLPENSMTDAASHDVTQLLLAWRAGDERALDQLTPLIYDELRRLAARYLRRERAEHTLQPTALVHEAYLQLIGEHRIDWQSRAHFIGIAAMLMRRILVDHARAHAATKRGQGAAPPPINEAKNLGPPTPPAILALDDALRALAKHDPRKCQIVELRYFGGLSLEEIAEVMVLSVATIRRDLRMAEAWLGRQMQK